VSASSSVAWWVLVLNSAKVVGTWDERWVATTVAPWCKHCATNSQPIPREAPTTKIVDCSVIGFLALCSSTGASPGRTEIAAGCRGIGGILLLLVVVVVVVVLLVVVGFVVLVVASLAIVSSEDDEAVTTPVVVHGANRDDEEEGATKGDAAAVVMNRDRRDDAAVACWNGDTPIPALVVHDDDRRKNTKKKSDRGPVVRVAAVITVITVAVRTIQGRIFIVFFFIVNKYKYFCKYYRSHRSF